jgi:hypothetical protein
LRVTFGGTTLAILSGGVLTGAEGSGPGADETTPFSPPVDAVEPELLSPVPDDPAIPLMMTLPCWLAKLMLLAA